MERDDDDIVELAVVSVMTIPFTVDSWVALSEGKVEFSTISLLTIVDVFESERVVAIEDGDSLELKIGTKVVSVCIVVAALEIKSAAVDETDACVVLLVSGPSVTLIELPVTVVCCCDSLKVEGLKVVASVGSEVHPEVNVVGLEVLVIDVAELLLLLAIVPMPAVVGDSVVELSVTVEADEGNVTSPCSAAVVIKST